MPLGKRSHKSRDNVWRREGQGRDAKGLHGQAFGLEFRPPEARSLGKPSDRSDHGAADGRDTENESSLQIRSFLVGSLAQHLCACCVCVCLAVCVLRVDPVPLREGIQSWQSLLALRGTGSRSKLALEYFELAVMKASSQQFGPSSVLKAAARHSVIGGWDYPLLMGAAAPRPVRERRAQRG